MQGVRAVGHLSMIKAVSDALLDNDNLVAPIAAFVSNYVEKKENLAQPKKKGPRATVASLISDWPDNDDNPF